MQQVTEGRPADRLPAVTIRKRRKATWEWTCTCERCGHTWKAVGDKAPERCAGCKAAHWDRPSAWVHPKREKAYTKPRPRRVRKS